MLRFVQRAGDLLVVGALRDACSVVIVLSPGRRGAGARASRRRARLALGGARRRAARGRERGHRRGRGRGRLHVRARRPRPLGGALPLRAGDRPGRRAAARPRLASRSSSRATRRPRPTARAVGYEVVHRADLEPAGLPAVVYAYGGWNVALVRGSLGANAQLVEAGAAFVLAHIRGGGEEGTGFHRDGALERKQHSYDDLYAVAEDLAARGIADPARIAVLGGSNGGLMVAVAVTQRPDLWCAACSLVPVTDMLRYHLSPYGETGLREYGDPDDPTDAAVLRAYSPYHNIRAGPCSTRRRSSSRERTTCAAPPGTPASSSRACRPTAAGGPFVLRVMGGGHLSTRRGADLVAEWQGFLLRELGLAETGSAPGVAWSAPLRCTPMRSGRRQPLPAGTVQAHDGERRFRLILGALVALRLAIPLVTLAFSGHALPGCRLPLPAAQRRLVRVLRRHA